VAAASVLVQSKADELYGRLADTAMRVAKGTHPLPLRRRAAAVLMAIPAGLDPLYKPIQAELLRDQPERALATIEETFAIIPDDVNLFWWRGFALRKLGRLELAAESYQRAFDLENQASVIPQALAQTFLELGDVARASESARRGVELNPGDADAQAILAWCSYKNNETQTAIDAASKAVALDPVHGDAVLLVLLAHLREGDLENARKAFQHARLVHELLSPGLDTSFVATFLRELRQLEPRSSDLSALISEIMSSLDRE
jgi:tetratricopeptide (TPR) repeat protein